MRVAEQVQRLRDAALDSATPQAAREEYVAALGEIDELVKRNPLQAFEPHPPIKADEGVSPQEEFFTSRTPIVAAFAGNRFGKTTGLVVRSLLECVDVECLPEHLKTFKRWDKTTAPRGTFGRIVCPDFTATAEGVILPAFRRWGPKDQWLGGSFDKAWDKQLRTLRFRNGSWIQVMTYEQDLDKFGGAALHFVGFDEPPPQQIREECFARLVDFGGYEMFAMTPLKANTGWIRREIYKKRESPDITVVRGSIHHNQTLDESTKARFLGGLSSDLWRRAREFGDFVDIGGLIYTDFERTVVPRPLGDLVRGLDVVVSIDPGVRNAALIFGGFDNDDALHIFDEMLLQDKTPDDYVAGVDEVLKRWGVPRKSVTFVIDPAARARAQVNAETVESALTRLGVYCVHGQNNVEAGIQQIRSRIQYQRLYVSEECRGLRDEADEYAAEDRADGEFKPVKQNDHRLDALRYLAMYRPYDPVAEQDVPTQQLGWTPGRALSAREIRRPVAGPPLGSMS